MEQSEYNNNLTIDITQNFINQKAIKKVKQSFIRIN